MANWVFDSLVERGRTNDPHSKFDHRILRVSRNLRFCAFVFLCVCAHVCPVLKCVTRPVRLKPIAVNHAGSGVGRGVCRYY